MQSENVDVRETPHPETIANALLPKRPMVEANERYLNRLATEQHRAEVGAGISSTQSEPWLSTPGRSGRPGFMILSVRHQHRNGGVFQHVARRATQNGLAQAAMAIGAYKQHVGPRIGNMLVQHVRGAEQGFAQNVNLAGHAVARQHLAQHAARIGFVSAVGGRADSNNTHQIGTLQHGQGFVHRRHRFGRFVPCHHDSLELGSRFGVVWQHQHG